MQQLKMCSKCAESLPLSNFYLDPRCEGRLRKACKSCMKRHCKKYLSTNGKDVRKIYEDAYYKSESLIKKRSEYRSLEINRFKNIKYQKEYRSTHKDRFAHYAAKYRATKTRQTPPWLTEEQLNQIKLIYNRCPVGFHVDHIVPLQGKDVKGLHVPWNLQYLPAEANIKKSNKHE